MTHEENGWEDSRSSPTYPPSRSSRGFAGSEDDAALSDDESNTMPSDARENVGPMPLREFLIRGLALLCACSLSIGSHFGNNLLGPLKSRLHREMGTNNTEFSLMISALSLNSTWTPLVGGLLASTLGTTYTSVLATGLILLGQALLLIGNLAASVRIMALGLFVFGLGVSPLAVVQETIIVRFFRSHGLGLSMALGLVAGKASSFVAARTSYPLTERYGPHAPFAVATTLAAISVVVNLLYVAASRWIVRGTRAELEAAELSAEAQQVGSVSEAAALEHVARKKRVHLRDLTKLGDVFWAYIAINILCGSIWSPFHHLAPNIIERRYGLSESEASYEASYLLAGSIFLYPVVGTIVDRFKRQGIIARLLVISSAMTAASYLWLVLPPSVTATPVPAIAGFALGQGFAPLLLVVLVPEIVASKYVSTTLGAHKALEQSGSTMFQTLAGLSLDIDNNAESTAGDSPAIQQLLNTFLFLNLLQLAGVVGLKYLRRRREVIRPSLVRLASDVRVDPPIVKERSPGGDVDEDEDAGDEPSSFPSGSLGEQRRPLLPRISSQGASVQSQDELIGDGSASIKGVATSTAETRRGEMFAMVGGGLIVLTWIVFMVTAWLRLRSKSERTSPPS